MVSLNKPAGSFDLDISVRLLLLFNNSIALALSFACMDVLFIVIGSILGISIIFNLLAILAKVRSNHLRSKDDDNQKQCPQLFVLGMDILGVLAFVSLYVCSTIEAATRSSWHWTPTLLMAYASIGTLVASAMHGYMACKNLQRYILYRQSLSSRCPHCHQNLSFVVGSIALPPSPMEQGEPTAGRKQSFSANSDGEDEGDALIMKP